MEPTVYDAPTDGGPDAAAGVLRAWAAARGVALQPVHLVDRTDLAAAVIAGDAAVTLAGQRSIARSARSSPRTQATLSAAMVRACGLGEAPAPAQLPPVSPAELPARALQAVERYRRWLEGWDLDPDRVLSRVVADLLAGTPAPPGQHEAMALLLWALAEEPRGAAVSGGLESAEGPAE